MRSGVKSAVLGMAAALAFGGLALAQELQLDPKALDASVAAAAGKKAKGKRAAPVASAPAPEGKGGKGQQGGKTPDRQFGELEGWSPGKAPPKPKDKDDSGAFGPRSGGLGVSPSGNMSVGLPF